MWGRPASEAEYQAVAEVERRADRGRVVAFHFTTTWPKPAASIASPEARVAVQQALRDAEKAFRKEYAALNATTDQRLGEHITVRIPVKLNTQIGSS